MPGEAERPPTYEVRFDSNRVERQEVAINRDGDEGYRYTVQLIGPVDDRWRKTFRSVQTNETGFYRYRLEEPSNTVRFLSSRSDRLEELLARLKSFLALVNEEASSSAL